MENLEQLKKVEETIKDDIDLLYDSTSQNLYQNFKSVLCLDNIYQKITGKKMFDCTDFLCCNKDLFYDIEAKHEKDVLSEKIFEDKNIKQLKNDNILKYAAKEMNKFIVSNLKDIINGTVIRNNIKLSDEEKRKIMNGFLNSNTSYEDNLYDRLMKEGRIIFLDKNLPDVGGLTYTHASSDVVDDSLIFINPYESDLYSLNILSHEIGHLIELEKLKKSSPEKYYKFQRLSLFNEFNSTLSQFKFLNYLEKENYPIEDINDVKTEMFSIISSAINSVNIFVEKNELFEGENMTNNLKYSYGALMSIYFDSIDSKEKLDDVTEKFEQEKLITNNLDMFNKVECTSKVLVKSMKDQIQKCNR